MQSKQKIKKKHGGGIELIDAEGQAIHNEQETNGGGDILLFFL